MNEAPSREWAGDDWRVIARPGQVRLTRNETTSVSDSKIDALTVAWKVICRDHSDDDAALNAVRMYDALEAAIAYAWPVMQ